MKFKMTPTKICAAMILAVVTFGFSLASFNSALTGYEKRRGLSFGTGFEKHLPEAEFVSELSHPTSDLRVRLFQLMFILFFISPPIIVVMLFLIWKELRARNRMK